MNCTAKDLEENLRKMVAVGDLLRAARAELQELIRANPAGADTPIPDSVWTKVRTALNNFEEVNHFVASLKA
jgi:hypothetical protein